MTTLALAFTNFGPYHLARLRALARALGARGDRLVAIEVAGQEAKYPWQVERIEEPFARQTLFPDRRLESLGRGECAAAMIDALDRERPDAVAVVGYVRPESMAMLRWAKAHDVPAILMSESQEIDHPRVWWKEAVKRGRVRRFASALVGGPSHRDYLVRLGMPRERIALGYNAVDHEAFVSASETARRESAFPSGLPSAPFFLSVCRFAPEKNLIRLIEAYAFYRDGTAPARAWDLVLCGSGPCEAEIAQVIASYGLERHVHRPGFMQGDALPRWYAHASAFVLPSLQEPWGLVANEAAACGLPLLVSTRAGCVDTLVPLPPGRAGNRFDPLDVADMARRLDWVATLPEPERLALGLRARDVAASWGPDRFAAGTLEALDLAARSVRRRPSYPRPFFLRTGTGATRHTTDTFA